MYAVMYTDGTYMTYEFTEEDYNLIALTMCSDQRVAVTSLGILVLTDIRSIIKQKPQEQPAESESAYPNIDQESRAWINANMERDDE